MYVRQRQFIFQWATNMFKIHDRKHKIIGEIIIKFHTMEQMVNLLQRAVCNDLFYLFLKIILTRAEHNLFFITQGGYCIEVLKGYQIKLIHSSPIDARIFH